MFGPFQRTYYPLKVNRYAVLVTEEVIPKAFWGGNENFEVIKRCGYYCSQLLASF